MNTLLQLKNVSKFFTLKHGFRKEVIRAVDAVDLHIQQGESVGLVGESGSGKSTLARLIVKLYQADQGKIIFQGTDVAKLSQGKFHPFRRDVQMVFQDPYSSLDPRYTVRQILQEALQLVPRRLSEEERQMRMLQVLEAVALPSSALRRFPHEFSGGERQRIAIARALMMEPKLLILDEAVSSLDVLVQAQIINLLKDIAKEFGVTYLFITHNLRVVRRLCARIAVMYQGRIVEHALTQELFDNPLHRYTKKLLKAAIDYAASDQETAQSSVQNSRLIDKGNGHFVLQ